MKGSPVPAVLTELSTTVPAEDMWGLLAALFGAQPQQVGLMLPLAELHVFAGAHVEDPAAEADQVGVRAGRVATLVKGDGLRGEAPPWGPQEVL